MFYDRNSFDLSECIFIEIRASKLPSWDAKSNQKSIKNQVQNVTIFQQDFMLIFIRFSIDFWASTQEIAKTIGGYQKIEK